VVTTGRKSGERAYNPTSRFIVKCHRPDGTYACHLCYRYRERDTICESQEGLVNHVANKHDVREYEGDPDIREVSKSW
jgi:hypothetical protein